MVRWMIAIALVATAAQASADPSHVPGAKAKPPIQTKIAAAPDAPKTCAQPACAARDGEHAQADESFQPVDVKIPIGGIAVASMEGLWLRRGPTLRNKPIMVSPIVVGNALTLSLGGSF